MKEAKKITPIKLVGYIKKLKRPADIILLLLLSLQQEQGSLQPKVTADLESACLRMGLGDFRGKVLQIVKYPLATNKTQCIIKQIILPNIAEHMLTRVQLNLVVYPLCPLI